MKFLPFIGSSYTLPSVRADCQSAINLYVETDESGAGKSPAQLVGAPGLALLHTLPTSPVRGIWIGEDRCFVVAGSKLYEVDSTGAPINGIGGVDRGDVGNDGKPAQVMPSANGNQLAIVSAGKLWVDGGLGVVQPTFPGYAGVCNVIGMFAGTTSTVFWSSGDKFDSAVVGRMLMPRGAVITSYVSPTEILITYAPGFSMNEAFTISGGAISASCGTMLDGYAVVAIPGSAQINISKHNDFSTWAPLDFAVKEGYPDHLVGVIADHQDLYLIGKQTVEIWRDSGNPDFPFQRIPGAVLQLGSVAPSSIDKLVQGIALLGADTRGGPIAYHVQGYQSARISTHALEAVWAGYANVTDAVGFSYIDAGHHFWELSFPSANATWVYDATQKEWHQRGWWNGATLDRTRAYLHGYVFGKHVVGDWQTGKLYEMSRAYFDHAGTAILRQRAAPHISEENKRTFFAQFTLDVLTGEAVDSPAFILDWSTDGGKTWSAGRTVQGGAIGNFLTRIIWRRLGASRDRVFRVTSFAPIRHTWIAAYLDAQAGTS